ncbi:MAG: fibronectin type III domain-containing protein [Bacteroidia bacterium]
MLRFLSLIPNLDKVKGLTSTFCLFLLALLFSTCKHTNPNIVNETCKCENLTELKTEKKGKNSVKLQWRGGKQADAYELILKNINSQQVETLKIDSLSHQEAAELYIDNLKEGTTYSFQLRSICTLANCQGNSYSPTTEAMLVAIPPTDCEGTANLIINEVKEDTIGLSWYGLNTQNFVRINVADTAGTVVFQQDYLAPPVTVTNPPQMVPYDFRGATNLPNGDYVLWVENICNDETSGPTEIGIFNIYRTTGGGGPIVIVEDNIDIYQPNGCASCGVNLPTTNTLTNNCLKEVSVNLLQAQVPKQVFVGYKLPGNLTASCAPTQSNLWRIKAYQLPSNIVLNSNNNSYRIALPPITCLCSNQNYQLKVVARQSMMPLSNGQTYTQNGCTYCN